MARTTGSDLICKALKLEGVKNVFGLAGDHILPLLNTMVDQDFRIIDTRHEQAAVHMADAWSRITEQPGVCMYTTPGFANAIPGLTNAMHTEGAVISIAGCADTHDLGRGAQQEIEPGRYGRASVQRLVHWCPMRAESRSSSRAPCASRSAAAAAPCI